ncbi:putative TonB protein [Desulfovibrionales bacterium]
MRIFFGLIYSLFLHVVIFTFTWLWSVHNPIKPIMLNTPLYYVDLVGLPDQPPGPEGKLFSHMALSQLQNFSPPISGPEEIVKAFTPTPIPTPTPTAESKPVAQVEIHKTEIKMQPKVEAVKLLDVKDIGSKKDEHSKPKFKDVTEVKEIKKSADKVEGKSMGKSDDVAPVKVEFSREQILTEALKSVRGSAELGIQERKIVGSALSSVRSLLEIQVVENNSGYGGGSGGSSAEIAYLHAVTQIIKNNWSFSNLDHIHAVAQVQVRIDSTGQILDFFLKGTSGYIDFDASAMKALVLTQQLQGLPPPPTLNVQIFVLNFNSQEAGR